MFGRSKYCFYVYLYRPPQGSKERPPGPKERVPPAPKRGAPPGPKGGAQQGPGPLQGPREGPLQCPREGPFRAQGRGPNQACFCMLKHMFLTFGLSYILGFGLYVFLYCPYDMPACNRAFPVYIYIYTYMNIPVFTYDLYTGKAL